LSQNLCILLLAHNLIFTRVGTYVQRGSKFCFVVVLVVVVLGVTVIAQNIAFLSNFTMHSAALLGSLALHACPAALPGSLSRQPCPAAIPGSLARQPCTACVSGSLDRQFDQFRPDLMRALARSAVTALYYSGRSLNCPFCKQYNNESAKKSQKFVNRSIVSTFKQHKHFSTKMCPFS
jgi:hypothetical protein